MLYMTDLKQKIIFALCVDVCLYTVMISTA